MKKALVLSLFSVVVFAAEEKPDFKGMGLPFSVQQEAVNRHATHPDIKRPAAALAAPGGVSDGHWVHCLPVVTGFGKTVQLSKSSAFDSRKKDWAVNLTDDEFPRDSDKYSAVVEDGKVKVEKATVFEKARKEQDGFFRQVLDIVTYTVRATVSSEKSELGHSSVGCIPQPVKSVELTTVCFDTVSVPPKAGDKK